MAKKKDVDYGCMKIRCKDNNLIPFLYKKMKATKHFENILLILIDQDYKQNNSLNFDDLTCGEVMRAVLRDNDGGEYKERVSRIKDFYKNNELMKSLIEVSMELKIHNLVEQIKDIKKNYSGYFTKIKNGDKSARPPKPCKLSKISNATIFTDGYKSFSYKMRKKAHKEKKIGINLDFKMRYTHLPHKYIEKVVGKMENICNVNINYSNGNFYFLINYDKKKITIDNNMVEKWAGIDPGVDNLLSIYIDDEDSNSLIVDGSSFVHYNTKFNRFIGKISSEIQYNKNLKEEYKIGLDVQGEIRKLTRFRSFLYEKRNNYFYSEFNKISCRVLDYLKLHKVTHVAIPRNLASLKYNGDCGLRKDIKQSFIQIPFMELINFITRKAAKYGITVVNVDEAYTSKTSSLSQDIINVQFAFENFKNLSCILKEKCNSELSANVFKGKRAKRRKGYKKGHRGDFYDYLKNVFINSDLNGAKNICSLGKGSICENRGLFKLCNPLKFKSDHELMGLSYSIVLG